MATITKQSCLAEIGETAGQVWHLLSDKSPLTIAKLVKEVDAPRNTVMQALGWLGEDKIEIEEDGRNAHRFAAISRFDTPRRRRVAARYCWVIVPFENLQNAQN